MPALELRTIGEEALAALTGTLPLKAYSRCVRALATIPVPRRWRPLVLGEVARRLGMNMNEAEHDLSAYRSAGELFVRRLRSGVRSVAPSPAAVVSPVDGCLSASGAIVDGRLIQAKGIDYTVADLLDDPTVAASSIGGYFFTIYLRPSDYHRIHVPLDGAVTAIRRVPGRLLPVKPMIVRRVPGLFATNERVVIHMASDLGPASLVCVGAAGVGNISTVFPEDERSLRRFDPPFRMHRGDEIAAFHLGSTVIVLLSHDAGQPLDVLPGAEIRIGDVLAWKDRNSQVTGLE